MELHLVGFFQSICADVCGTPTQCAGVHTECREGAEGYFIECAVSVRAGKHQVCSVRKFGQIKKLKKYTYLKPKPLNVFYDA